MSTQPLTELQQEHRNLGALLDILERQFGSLEARGEPNWEVMSELLAYLNNHPEQHHDRYEAYLWRRLSERAPECDALGAALAAEQEQVANAGRQLQVLVARVLDNQIVARSQVAQAGQRFVARFRGLIEREETDAWPALAAHLRPSDWVELTTERHWCWEIGQPMALPYESRYESLCRSIVLQAGKVWPPTSDARARCPVCDRG